MPAILRVEDDAEWLDPRTLTGRLRNLSGPYPAEAMEAWPVSQHVNPPAHPGERCIRPVG
jgi:putative SOS response-associated peptidase YedK